MTVEAPIAVLFALILRSEEDLADARDRAITLAAGARLAHFTREEAEAHLFRVYGHVMPAGDRITVARWMASLCPHIDDAIAAAAFARWDQGGEHAIVAADVDAIAREHGVRPACVVARARVLGASGI